MAQAPDPDDIFWLNIGRSHESLQLGKLAGIVCTVILCLFWTIPIAFISGMSNLESLAKTLPFLEQWIEAAPWLAPLLAQLAPLMIIVLNQMLPAILGAFCKLEGPISSSVLEASLFAKQSAFMVSFSFRQIDPDVHPFSTLFTPEDYSDFFCQCFVGGTCTGDI